MEYSFDDDSPRFALNSVWFLVGVIVFAFSVLIMTAIVSGGQERGYYLNVQPSSQETKPATGAQSAGAADVTPASPRPRNRPS